MKTRSSWSGETIPEGDRIARYAQVYSDVSADDFEKTLVHYRQRSLVEYLSARRMDKIIEVGCGLDLLVLAAVKAKVAFSQWTIVEPSSQFAASARQQTADMTNVEVVEAFFEAAESKLDLASGNADLVILSGLLHEVTDPDPVMALAFKLLRPGGRVFAIVPNVASLHRRLALAMGLIGELAQPSERNLQLMQRRIFDLCSLVELCTRHNFEVVDTGGLFLKPFTHAQMALIAPHLPSDVMTGLWRLGQQMPEFASEIFVEARHGASLAGNRQKS